MPLVTYADSLTVPANTTWASPEELVFVVPTGTIVEYYIHGAPEHQHQVAIAIYHPEHRIFPEGEGEYFYPCAVPAVFAVETVMTPGIRRVVVRGGNTDPYYPHTVYIAVTVETGIPARRLMERVWNLMLGRGIGG